MKRRTKTSHTAATRLAAGPEGLRIGEAKGLVKPLATAKTTTIALRMSGPWHDLWERLRDAVPEVSDSELLRQGVALRMALAARDGLGRPPRVSIEFHDDQGKLVRADLREYIGLAEPSDDSAD